MSALPPLSIAELMPGHEDNAWLLDLPTELSLGDFDAALAEFIGFMPDPATCAHNSAHTSDQDQECTERQWCGAGILSCRCASGRGSSETCRWKIAHQ